MSILTMVFCHMLSVARDCKVQHEGPAEHFFNNISLDDPEGVVDVAAADDEEGPIEVPTV